MFFLTWQATLWVQFACKSTEKTVSRPWRAANIERGKEEMGQIVLPPQFPCPWWRLSFRTWQTGDLKLKSRLSHQSSPLSISRQVILRITDESRISGSSTVVYVWGKGRSRHASKTYASMTVMSKFTHGHKMQHNRCRQNTSFPAGALQWKQSGCVWSRSPCLCG